MPRGGGKKKKQNPKTLLLDGNIVLAFQMRKQIQRLAWTVRAPFFVLRKLQRCSSNGCLHGYVTE